MNSILYFAPKSRYQEKHDESAVQRDHVRKKTALISNLRLLTVVFGITGMVIAYRAGNYPAAGVCTGVTILLFAMLALRHGKLFRLKDELTALIEINRMGGDRWSDAWRTFEEAGEAFVDHDHPYTSDLDVFGPGSLFQYCCCAHTYYGKLRLAELLQFRDGDSAAIRSRQKAVEELAERFSWRQRFEAAGFASAVAGDPQPLVAWAESGRATKRIIWHFVLLLPFCGAAAALTGWLFNRTFLYALPVFAVQVLIASITAVHNFRLFSIFDRYKRALEPFGNLIGCIEHQEFADPHLQELRREILGKQERTGASAAMLQLGKIIDATETRFSPLPWFLANAVLLWDIRCSIRLEQWKSRNGSKVRSWLGCVGAFEALSSLALLRFDHSDWVFPDIVEGNEAVQLRAEGIGHPLLQPKECVVNDLTLGTSGGSIGIVTGSNMSGKSTFLRSVGCNLVLAYAGGPVCARTLSVPLVAIYTSMRTEDNLMSHTSTFYAELLRIRKIVDAANRGQPLLFLVDELFSGTNSADRHDGAVTLLGVLSKPYTLGLVATHDLALCSLAESEPQYRNYHFREEYEGEELHFDYLLREGPSITRNALFLMRKAGIVVGGTEGEK